MTTALIGYTGYVGSTLLKQTQFDELYSSENIEKIKGKTFETIICAGAPGQKWIANKNPSQDLESINSLINSIKHTKCKNFILISTVDVFQSPIGVDENTQVCTKNLHAYGLHRHLLEEFVKEHFNQHLIVRLPGLVGPGLRKNVIFDFLNNNNLEAFDCRSIFQFYPMVNLHHDIQIALKSKLSLIHLTSAPISIAHIAEHGFSTHFSKKLPHPPVRYDMQTLHSNVFGVSDRYLYTPREVDIAIRAYAQSEPVTLKACQEIP